jgi:hypothetical protein
MKVRWGIQLLQWKWRNAWEVNSCSENEDQLGCSTPSASVNGFTWLSGVRCGFNDPNLKFGMTTVRCGIQLQTQARAANHIELYDDASLQRKEYKTT